MTGGYGDNLLSCQEGDMQVCWRDCCSYLVRAARRVVVPSIVAYVLRLLMLPTAAALLCFLCSKQDRITGCARV